MEEFHRLLIKHQCEDLEVIQFLKYGWPINLLYQPPSLNISSNQKGAKGNSNARCEFIDKETKQKSIIGPFPDGSDQFKGSRILPLDAIPKKDSPEMRIILNLSYPWDGESVNNVIAKDSYLGKLTKLSYPTIDDLITLIRMFGIGYAVFKTDMKKAFW